MKVTDHLHLTYCSNIHPGTGWDEHFEALKANVPAIREQAAPGQPFGIGLRLAQPAAASLIQPETLAVFKQWLEEHNLYVFTINAFPYGDFHGTSVKDHVYSPDWTTSARVAYTNACFRILHTLLPSGMTGGVSTCPVSYRHWHTGEEADNVLHEAAENIMNVVCTLYMIKEEEGKTLHLDIEPEPDGLIENTSEVISFFNDILLPIGREQLKTRFGLSDGLAADVVREHVRICYDICHFAIMYEAPEYTIRQLKAANIKIGRLQISAALEARFQAKHDHSRMIQTLRQFNEPVYLHQVVENSKGALTKYHDLPDALEHVPEDDALWRIHFHVPVFTATYEALFSTQKEIIKCLALLQRYNYTQHLEIETYTWNILPGHLKKDIIRSITRELDWVKQALAVEHHLPEGNAPGSGTSF